MTSSEQFQSAAFTVANVRFEDLGVLTVSIHDACFLGLRLALVSHRVQTQRFDKKVSMACAYSFPQGNWLTLDFPCALCASNTKTSLKRLVQNSS